MPDDMISTAEPVFSALDTDTITPDGSPRSYTLRVPSYRQANAVRRLLRQIAGTDFVQAVLLDTLREVMRQIAPPNLAEVLAQIDEAEATPEDRRAQARLQVIEAAAMPVPAYAEMVDRRDRYVEQMPVVRLRHMLVDWRGPGLPPFATVGGLAPEDIDDIIPAPEFAALARRAESLLVVGRAMVGNSGAPTTSPATPPISPEG